MTEDEKSLISQAQHGNQKAFEQLYNKYYRLIRYIIFDAVKDHDLTDDLISITFCKAYEKINYFVDSISFEAWLKTIAINTIIDYVRKKKKLQNSINIDDDENDFQIIDDDKDPETELIHSESLCILEESLKHLRAKYRNLIKLKYFDKLTYEQISAKLGKPDGTIKSDLAKAKQKLREIFNKLSKNFKS